ncbi:MAG: CHAT domain-containing protein, partial [Saprospiraceae bacterium]|nr:CHAT domain-containing protein [Saprospiraceae bacterium]
LKSGEKKDEALRNARLDYLEQASATHPFYWATFVFIGDPKPLTEGNGLPYWWLGIGVLLLAVAFFVWRNRPQTAA